ncbi:MAG: GNAT family N-acetyltransferase [Alphaproteobacteria bacterium]
MTLTSILRSILGDNFKPREDEFISPHITIWYLKRTSSAVPNPDKNFSMEQVTTPDPDWYRQLYKDVGGPWMWWERIAMKDETFVELFAKGDRLVITPIVDGQIAGFCEILFADPKYSEIVYFGLKPEFLGKGIARAFMEEAVAIARRDGAEEVRLNTCTLDHPNARHFYKKLGYEEYHSVEGPVHIPKALLDTGALETRV